MNVSSINYLNNYQYSDTSSQNEIQENNVPNLWNMKVKSNNENFKDLVSSFSIVDNDINNMKKITYSKIPLNNFWKEISKDILSPFKPKIPTIINSLIFKIQQKETQGGKSPKSKISDKQKINETLDSFSPKLHKSYSEYKKISSSPKKKIITKTNPTTHPFEKMYTEQQDYNYQITELINNEIIQKKKRIRRKSCHCSECGFLTKFEKLTMGLKSYLKKIKDEEKDDSTVSMRGSSVGFRNRGKTQDPKLKYKKDGRKQSRSTFSNKSEKNSPFSMVKNAVGIIKNMKNFAGDQNENKMMQSSVFDKKKPSIFNSARVSLPKINPNSKFRESIFFNMNKYNNVNDKKNDSIHNNDSEKIEIKKPNKILDKVQLQTKKSQFKSILNNIEIKQIENSFQYQLRKEKFFLSEIQNLKINIPIKNKVNTNSLDKDMIINEIYNKKEITVKKPIKRNKSVSLHCYRKNFENRNDSILKNKLYLDNRIGNSHLERIKKDYFDVSGNETKY